MLALQHTGASKIMTQLKIRMSVCILSVRLLSVFFFLRCTVNCVCAEKVTAIPRGMKYSDL